jgi:hypothetical protein
MTPAPDFRALCAELSSVVYEYCVLHEGLDHLQPLVTRANTALATPPPEPPTDDELNALWNCCGNYDEEGDHYGNIFQFARAALKRWGAK